MPRSSVSGFTPALFPASLLASVLAFASACSSDPVKPPEPTWQLVQEKLPGGLLRIWGRNARDVYAVGADGDGQGSLALHFDGTRWTRLNTGTTGDLWWVHGVADDDIRMVGEDGLILRYHPSTGKFDRLTAPEAITLFGVWGRSSSDVWYVGGIPSGAKGVVWHDDGNTIAAPAHTLTTTTATLFKVHGFASGELWVVGQLGLSAFYDGNAFSEKSTGSALPIFTVHGLDPQHVFAVGGAAGGVIVRWDGTMWIDEAPPETPQMNGVWVVSDSLAYTAGFNGRMYRRDASAWTEMMDIPTFQDLHAVWVDEEGGIWAVGGRLASDPPKDGVLVHYGTPIATGL